MTQLKVTQINFPTRRGNSILEFFAIGTRFSDYLWEFFWFLHLKRSKKSDKLRKCKEIYSGASNSSAGSKSKTLKGNFENTENREKFKSRQWRRVEKKKIVEKSLSCFFLWKVKIRKSFKIANEQRFHFQDTIFRQNLNFPMDCDYSKLFYKRKSNDWTGKDIFTRILRHETKRTSF